MDKPSRQPIAGARSKSLHFEASIETRGSQKDVCTQTKKPLPVSLRNVGFFIYGERGSLNQGNEKKRERKKSFHIFTRTVIYYSKTYYGLLVSSVWNENMQTHTEKGDWDTLEVKMCEARCNTCKSLLGGGQVDFPVSICFGYMQRVRRKLARQNFLERHGKTKRDGNKSRRWKGKAQKNKKHRGAESL